MNSYIIRREKKTSPNGIPDIKIRMAMQCIRLFCLAACLQMADSPSPLRASIRNSGFSVPLALPLANGGLR